MITSFFDRATEDIFHGRDTKAARRCCPKRVWPVARRKLDYINRAVDIEDLRVPPGNRLEELSGDRQGQHSIRINKQYRICFSWGGRNANQVEITDYH